MSCLAFPGGSGRISYKYELAQSNYYRDIDFSLRVRIQTLSACAECSGLTPGEMRGWFYIHVTVNLNVKRGAYEKKLFNV